MITLIVGHRGSGKSNLLSYLQDNIVLCFDLDLKIEEFYGKNIKDIFSTEGEIFFRNLEKKVLYTIINNYQLSDKNIYVSVGAGFQGSIPSGVKVIWLQRKTDNQARIFFNRPRLDPNKSPSQEYKDRFLLRKKYYASVAHEVMCLPEHVLKPQLTVYENQTLPVENFFIHLQKFISLYLPTKVCFLTKDTKDTKDTKGTKNSKDTKDPKDPKDTKDPKNSKDLKDTSFILDKGGVTLEENMFKDRFRAKIFLEKRLAWGVLFFEVRDDLISKKTFTWIKSIIPLNKLFLSCRALKTYFVLTDLKSAWAWDWPIEKKLEACPFKIPFSVISLHSKKSLDKNIFSYLNSQINLANKYNTQYKNSKKVDCKWAPVIASLEELQSLYLWFKKDKNKRSILPVSLDGRWSWFRLYLYGKIKINFIKESKESCFKDQILLSDKIFTKNKTTSFAAILGRPILHSLTPFIHYDFFQNKNISIYSILLNQSEVTANNIDFLIQLGLKYAAITSPLKKEFFNLKYSKLKQSFKVKSRKSVNTLTVSKNKKNILLDNTDQEGLIFLVNSVLSDNEFANFSGNKFTNISDNEFANFSGNKFTNIKKKINIVLWGAGGVSSILEKVYPEIFIFSSQKKKCINYAIDEKKYFPDIVLWAVPSIYKNEPPKHWKPSHIIDLNYSEDSCGREYAILKKAIYTSGLSMFLVQAKEQQKLWFGTN